MKEEDPSYVQATTWSSRLVSSIIINFHNHSFQASVYSKSSISFPISEFLVHNLKLQIYPTPPISVLFGNNKHEYYFDEQVAYSFFIANSTFTHTF